MNQIINQLLRMFTNQLVNRGINQSIDTAMGTNAKDKTPEERRRARESATRTRKSISILRRFLR